MSIFPGPQPAYTNPPIMPQNFKPSRFEITEISLGTTTTVTTSVNNNYVIGQLVRLLIQPQYGCPQLNGQTAYVTSIPSPTEVTLDLNSQYADPFIPSPSFGPTSPQIVAVGDINSGIISTTGRIVPTTTIQGSFQNISN